MPIIYFKGKTMFKKSVLLDGNDMFKNSYFKENEKALLDLVKNGQSPKALFIGCADSRVIPSLIVNADPGDLFVIRNVGNFVAPYKPDDDFHATASGIEYAVVALNVSQIIVCGHTHCGAIASLYEDIDKFDFIHTKKWLSLGEKAKNLAVNTMGETAPKEELLRLSEKLSVISQIENLLTYPQVRLKVDAGVLDIHGWMYDLLTGEIEYYDPQEKLFKSYKTLES